MERLTLSEQETVIRYDRDERVLHLYTSWLVDAQRWEKLGYPVEVMHRYGDGSPSGWRAVPVACLRPLRRLVNGQIVKRKAPATAFPPGYRGGSSTKRDAARVAAPVS